MTNLEFKLIRPGYYEVYNGTVEVASISKYEGRWNIATYEDMHCVNMNYVASTLTLRDAKANLQSYPESSFITQNI